MTFFTSGEQAILQPKGISNNNDESNKSTGTKMLSASYYAQRVANSLLSATSAMNPIQSAEAQSESESGPNSPNDPRFLQPTSEVVIDQAITDLAAQLNNSTVEISNWIRNNIDYLPTHGAIQNASLTLRSKRGNAYDISSLLIALLRAANIPSRYVSGTVEVDAERIKNWLGGIEDINSAVSLMTQGGIPTNVVVSGGQIHSIRFEHVWVEAWVDYFPVGEQSTLRVIAGCLLTPVLNNTRSNRG